MSSVCRCLTRKHTCWMLSVVSLACFSITYYILIATKNHTTSFIRSFTLQSLLPRDNFAYHPNKASVADEPPDTRVLNRFRFIEELLLKNSTCNDNDSQVNMTQCPGCFREGVDKLMLQNITSDDFVLGQNKSYFQTLPGVMENTFADYLITPSLDCPYLLAVQPSVKDRANERDLVRRTWGSVAKTQTWPNRTINAKVKLIFVVANIKCTHNENESNYTPQFVEILSEALIYNDILYIDMEDSYQNLTLKVLSAFRWVKDNCPCVKFVLKVDFDTFVNVPLLVDTLLHHEDYLQLAALGWVYSGSNPVERSGRWAVPKSMYPLKNYPKYASGCGYVLPVKVLCQIVDTAPNFPAFTIEDAFITGVLRILIGFRLFSLPTAFTHYNDKEWHTCDVFHDKKILAMSGQGLKHELVWQTFHEGTCSLVRSESHDHTFMPFSLKLPVRSQ